MSQMSLSSTSQIKVPRKPPQRADQGSRGGRPSSNAITRCFLVLACVSGLSSSDSSRGHWTYSAVTDLQVEKELSSWCQKSQASCSPSWQATFATWWSIDSGCPSCAAEGSDGWLCRVSVKILSLFFIFHSPLQREYCCLSEEWFMRWCSKGRCL